MKKLSRLYRYKTMHRQKGFIGYIIIGIALIAVVMAAIAYMSRSSTSGVSQQGAKTTASVLLKQVADMKTGYDRLVVNGTVTPASITFDTTSGTGLFDPAGGFAIQQNPPAAAMTTAVAYTYTKLDTLLGVGTTAADYVVTLGNITQPVCQQINQVLYNSTTIPSVTATLAQLTSAPAAVADGTGANSGRNQGCVVTSDTSYVFYSAMSEN